jgi:hypothetical protein
VCVCVGIGWMLMSVFGVCTGVYICGCLLVI